MLNEHILVGSPAGGAFASAPDLVRFARALREERLLDSGWAAVVLSNYDQATAPVDTLVRKLVTTR